MKILKKLMLLCALVPGIAFAQTAVVGTKVVDNSNNLLTGKWCFAGTCFTTTTGVIANPSSVTSATGTVTITNTASSITYLTVPNVAISGSLFSWDTFVLPTNASASGLGQPRIACMVGSSYTQTDAGNAIWSCASVNGVSIWVGESAGSAVSPGQYAGSGIPTFACTSPCTYTRADASPTSGASYAIVAVPGIISTNWVQQGSSSSPTAATIAAAIQTQTGCTTSGNAWNPATNTCAPSSGGGASFPSSTTGLVFNTSPTASTNANSSQVQGVIGSGVYDASGAAAAAQAAAIAASDPAGSATAAVNATAITTAVKTQTGCSTNGNAWNPATGTCAPTSGGGANFPASTTGLVFNTSPTASTNATSAQVQTVIGSGVYDASGAAAAAQTAAEAASDPVGSATAAVNASAITTAISAQTGCSTAGTAWNPVTSTCVAYVPIDSNNNSQLTWQVGTGGDPTCTTSPSGTVRTCYVSAAGFIEESDNGGAFYIPVTKVAAGANTTVTQGTGASANTWTIASTGGSSGPSSFTALTDSSTVTLPTAGAAQTNATLTMVHTTTSRTLNVTGLANGSFFNLEAIQDSTGGAALVLGTGCTWQNVEGGTTAGVATAASAVTNYTVFYDGTNCFFVQKFPKVTAIGNVPSYTNVNGGTADSGTAISSLAPKASPTFTGSITTPIVATPTSVSSAAGVQVGGATTGLYGGTTGVFVEVNNTSTMAWTPTATEHALIPDCWGSTFSAPTTCITTAAAGLAEISTSATAGSGGSWKAASYISGGTTFTAAATGCAIGTLTGGASAGQFIASTAVACTIVVTTGITAPHGWACSANDITTSANAFKQTASSTTTFTLSGTPTAADVINFYCLGY